MNPDTWRQVARELNSITQLARDSANAERIAARISRVRSLIQGKDPEPKPGKKTRRRALWERDPRCFWCGRETDIRTSNAPDSATVEHLYARGRPKRTEQTRRHLPNTVLACRRCNSSRGAPSVAAPEVCPLLAAVKGER
jgi:5-methylcytosine-specific restriction endonuclease McrA